MRTAQRFPAAPNSESTAAIKKKAHVLPEITGKSHYIILSLVAFAAYISGLYYGGFIHNDALETLVSFYMNKQNYLRYIDVFLRAQAISVLQLSIITFLGLHLFGSALALCSVGFFTASSGACAACIRVGGGAKALVIWWMLSFCAGTANLLLIFYLYNAAYSCASVLLQYAAYHGAVKTSLHPNIQTKLLMKRYIIALGLSLPCNLLGALIAVFFAAVLL